jgi:hypothetical protein
LLRPRRTFARRCLWGAAMALGCTAVQAQGVDTNAIAVSFSGGDASGSAGVVSGVLLHVELTDDQIAESPGFRSMSLTVDVDCRGGRERLRKAEAFDQPNLAGPPRPHAASGEWATPEAYMGEVIKTICAMHGMRVALGGGAPAPARAPTAPAEPPTLSPPAAPAETAFSAAPSPAPTPDRAPDAPPAAVAAAPPSAPPPSPTAAAGFFGQARVQIASSPSRADAEARLGRSAALIASPLRGEVEVASVHGRTVYRSIIAPFATTSEAQEFCARARPNLDGCFVWPAR